MPLCKPRGEGRYPRHPQQDLLRYDLLSTAGTWPDAKPLAAPRTAKRGFKTNTFLVKLRKEGSWEQV